MDRIALGIGTTVAIRKVAAKNEALLPEVLDEEGLDEDPDLSLRSRTSEDSYLSGTTAYSDDHLVDRADTFRRDKAEIKDYEYGYENNSSEIGDDPEPETLKSINLVDETTLRANSFIELIPSAADLISYQWPNSLGTDLYPNINIPVRPLDANRSDLNHDVGFYYGGDAYISYALPEIPVSVDRNIKDVVMVPEYNQKGDVHTESEPNAGEDLFKTSSNISNVSQHSEKGVSERSSEALVSSPSPQDSSMIEGEGDDIDSSSCSDSSDISESSFDRCLHSARRLKSMTNTLMSFYELLSSVGLVSKLQVQQLAADNHENSFQYTGAEGLNSFSRQPSDLSSNQNRGSGNPRKRKQRNDDEDGDEEDGGDGFNQGIKRSRISEKPQILRWHCPFFARRPDSHKKRESCHKSGFRAISTVLDHIRRFHKFPVCYRCGLKFQSNSDFQKHQNQEISCKRKPHNINMLDILTEDMDREIHDKIRHKLRGRENDEKRWRQIYDILFPGETEENAPSPYWTPKADSNGPCECSPEFVKYRRREHSLQVDQGFKKVLDYFEAIEPKTRSELLSMLSAEAIRIFRNLPGEIPDETVTQKETPVVLETPLIFHDLSADNLGDSAQLQQNIPTNSYEIDLFGNFNIEMDFNSIISGMNVDQLSSAEVVDGWLNMSHDNKTSYNELF